MIQGWCAHSMKNMVRREPSLQSKVGFSSKAVPAHSHYKPGPISNPGYLFDVVAVERFEGILEKMDKCCRQDNTRSEVFSNEE